MAYQDALALDPTSAMYRRAITKLQCRVSAVEPGSLTEAAGRRLALRIKLAGLSAKDGAEIAIALSQVDLIQGKSAEAHAGFEQVAKQFPKSAIAQFVLGKSRLFRGLQTKAADALSRAVQLDGQSARYRRVLGQTLHATGKWARAADELRAAAERQESGLVRLMLGEAQLKLKKAPAAVESLQMAKRLLKKPKEMSRCLAALGYALYSIGKLQPAIGALSHSYRISQDDSTLMSLALAYQALKNHRKAAELFKGIMEKRPLDGPGHMRWLQSVMALGQKTRAQQIVLQMEKRAPSDAQLARFLPKARAMVGLGKGE
jgi:tetratricopeptide (TPR) repeat protein